MADSPVSAQPVAPQASRRVVVALVSAAFVLLTIIGAGLFLAFTASKGAPTVGAGWYLFSYVMGLTMIVLPCTLPLAFVIVPLSMGKGPKKGMAIALAFGMGVAITLSLYGVLAAVLGKQFLQSGSSLDTVKNWLYVVAGGFAYLFALGELGFLKVRMPTYSGAAPMFIQRQGDVVKALLLGLFMGNVGIGCPHPATPLILTRIAISNDVFYGWLLFFVHALGRITPLLFLAILGILGVNALSWVVKRRTVIERITGWAMVFVAGFIFFLGLFTHDGWVYSGQHSLLEKVTQEDRFLGIVAKNLNSGVVHEHGIPTGTGLFGLPYWLGPWVLVALWVLPMIWALLRRKRALVTLPAEEQEREKALLPYLKAFLATLAVLLAVVFAWALPHQFLIHWSAMTAHSHAGSAHTLDLQVSSSPEIIRAGEPVTLTVEFPTAELKQFSIEHSYPLHLILVRDDLQTFAHLHPTPTASSPATFQVTHTFPLSGNYLLAVNYLHAEQEGLATKRITVEGTDSSALPTNFSRVKNFNSYEVSLDTTPMQLVAGKQATLTWTVRQNGQLVQDMQPYLEALMHVAVVNDDLTFFVHTHGEFPKGDSQASVSASDMSGGHMHGSGALPAAFGPTIASSVTFPRPGIYQLFGQFQRHGEVVTTNFLVEVKE